MEEMQPHSVVAVKTKVNERVANIDFYTWETLPPKPKVYALSQGVTAAAVASSVSYDFVPIGNSVEGIKKFMEQLALEDGVDINKTVQNAFGKVEQ